MATMDQNQAAVSECFSTLDSHNQSIPDYCKLLLKSNSTSIAGEDFEMPRHRLNDPHWTGIVIVFYATVIILGALLNILVVATVIKTKQLWTTTNIFIANLATADIFVCIFDLPLSLYQAFTSNWIFGRALCHTIHMTFGVVVYTSTWTLTMIAVDRFILILFPMKTRMTNTIAIMLVVAIALMAIAVASPIAVYSKYEVYTVPEIGLTKYLCGEIWPTNKKHIYTILTLIVQFFLPLLVISLLYALIFRHLRLRMQKRSSRKTKTTKMLVAVVLVFAITWTPFHLYAIIMEFHPKLVPVDCIVLIDVLLKIFALSSSCINPFLYGWLNDNYRAAFLSFIRCPTKAPSGIQREDSDDMIKDMAANF